MPNQPLAYFITFSTYGTWLHGAEPGSVDREHNQFGSPLLESNDETRCRDREQMTQPQYQLDAPRRAVVRDDVVEECHFRGWNLLALHVRSNHVHVVVTTEQDPEFVMRNCKAHASQQLTKAGFDSRERKRWTRHGSTKYLWTWAAVVDKIEYTLHRQGDVMALYEGEWRTLVCEDAP